MFYADHFCAYNEDEDSYTFTGTCLNTGKSHTVKVSKDGLRTYRSGKPIQDAFPELDIKDVWFLVSGYTEGWPVCEFSHYPEGGLRHEDDSSDRTSVG